MAAEYGVQRKDETGRRMRIANGLSYAAAVDLVRGLRTPKAKADRLRYTIVKERS